MKAWWCGICKMPFTHGETECFICKERFEKLKGESYEILQPVKTTRRGNMRL